MVFCQGSGACGQPMAFPARAAAGQEVVHMFLSALLVRDLAHVTLGKEKGVNHSLLQASDHI